MASADTASRESRVHLDAVGTTRQLSADRSGVLPGLLLGALTGLLLARILLLLAGVARTALSGLLLPWILLLLTGVGRLIAGLAWVLGLVCHLNASLVHRSKGAPMPAWAPHWRRT